MEYGIRLLINYGTIILLTSCGPKPIKFLGYPKFWPERILPTNPDESGLTLKQFYESAAIKLPINMNDIYISYLESGIDESDKYEVKHPRIITDTNYFKVLFYNINPESDKYQINFQKLFQFSESKNITDDKNSIYISYLQFLEKNKVLYISTGNPRIQCNDMDNIFTDVCIYDKIDFTNKNKHKYYFGLYRSQNTEDHFRLCFDADASTPQAYCDSYGIRNCTKEEAFRIKSNIKENDVKSLEDSMIIDTSILMCLDTTNINFFFLNVKKRSVNSYLGFEGVHYNLIDCNDKDKPIFSFIVITKLIKYEKDFRISHTIVKQVFGNNLIFIKHPLKTNTAFSVPTTNW